MADTLEVLDIVDVSTTEPKHLQLDIRHLDIDGMAIDVIGKHLSNRYSLVKVPYNRQLLIDKEILQRKKNNHFCDTKFCTVSEGDIDEAGLALWQSLSLHKGVRSRIEQSNIDAYIYFFRYDETRCSDAPNPYINPPYGYSVRCSRTPGNPLVALRGTGTSRRTPEIAMNVGMVVFDREFKSILHYRAIEPVYVTKPITDLSKEILPGRQDEAVLVRYKAEILELIDIAAKQLLRRSGLIE